MKALCELNEVQKAIIAQGVCSPASVLAGKAQRSAKGQFEEFAPRFAPDAHLLYLGDTAKKNLFVDNAGLAELGIPITDRNWLFLIEAVTSHGPVTPKRILEIEDMLSSCSAGAVYVSAFPDFAEFRKHLQFIAWETEVWLCDDHDPDGDRFLGDRKRNGIRKSTEPTQIPSMRNCAG